MPELITDYGWAKLSQIDTFDVLDSDEKDKRMKYLGFEGNLLLFKSLIEHPGEYFLYIENFMHYFHTSCGELTVNEDSIELTTRHSKYRFTLIPNKTNTLFQ